MEYKHGMYRVIVFLSEDWIYVFVDCNDGVPKMRNLQNIRVYHRGTMGYGITLSSFDEKKCREAY